MAARLLYSLSDDNPDLQKQMGCMTGIFQIFDRQHIVSGRRIMGEKPPLGASNHSNGNSETESDKAYHERSPIETNSNKNVYEKQRLSTESSRISFSASSCSSSASSHDFYKSQPEPSSFNRPDAPSSCGSQKLGKKSLDFPDLIKESIYREKKGISVKSTRKKDSSKSVNGSYGFAKNQELPRYFNECNDFSSPFYESNDGYLNMVLKDNSRFSYDDKETKRRSFESRETIRSTQNQINELPRLSLDSKESSMLHFTNDDHQTTKRPHSVVAKLMGLDTLPDSQTGPTETLISTKTVNLIGPIRISDPLLHQWKGPTSPRRKNQDLAMKPVTNSRLPVEPAPWKHQDPSRVSPKANSRNFKSPVRESTNSPSVYSEIEKRLKDLEFKQSGKDLRALKQILEAMQTKGVLETQKEESTSNFGTRKDYEPKFTGQNPKLVNLHNPKMKSFDSPIVIMKPAKLVQKPGPDYLKSDGFSMAKEQSSKHTRRDDSVSSTSKNPNVKKLGHTQSSSRDQHLRKENNTSPRLQQKKAEVEKSSRPPIPSSDTRKSRSQLSKQQTESNSPGGKRRTKIEQNDDKMSDNSNESRNSSINGDHETSFNPESNNNGSKSLSMKGNKPKKSAPKLNEHGSSAEHLTVTVEHASPVSVLDATEYGDDPSSPVKQIENSFKGDENSVGTTPTSKINRTKLQNIENLVQKLERLNSSHDEARTDYIASLCDDTNTDHRYISEILLASGLLLRDLTTFQIHPSGQPINPELFFVLEQTKTKKHGQDNNRDKIHRKFIFNAVNEILVKKLGLLNANPGLRQSKITKRDMNGQKLLKELCFEIDQLQVKTVKCGFDEEDGDDLKKLLFEDVIYRSENWMDLNGEISGVVLDLERLVFKELVNEVVIGEMAARSRRVKLVRFSKKAK